MRYFLVLVISITLIFNITFFSLPVQASLDDDNGDGGQCTLGCIGDSIQQVFPFDIFSGIPASGDFECPKITIFSQDFEFCLLVNAISVLKFPLIIALLIKIYLFS